MDKTWAQEIFEKLKIKLMAECERNKNSIPYIPENGRYKDLEKPEGIFWWTNGFWPGMLWQMYNATKEELFRKTAENIEVRLDSALESYEGLHHDVGFMWLHTSTANYRLTGNKDSRRRSLHAANLLAGRYNPAGKFIRAWNKDRTGWIIIDCMMNLPLLYWASKEIDDPRYRVIGMEHAYTSINHLLRADGSCNHIAVLSPLTGECQETPAGQGFASGSSWSRGQGWAMYGFALSYRHTGDHKFLDVAKRIAHYVIGNFAQNDWLPLVDFRSPAEPVKYDSTAAMISACGLLEITSHVGEYEKNLYTNAALKLLSTAEKNFADWNIETDGIIGKGTAAYHGKPHETQVPIIYGDYFFTEAILRILEKDFLIW
ncbi:MAG: glycoside hydrolase family 88 protein [Treponema sp.]|jgi:unsaturated chondroitin disaccharide hydrolase|nr:glycoside hydrolase family 88 protein [Treponema sp.]